MSLFSRLKRLWEVSGEPPMPVEWAAFLTRQTRSDHPPTVATTGPGELVIEPVLPVKRMATIVQDDPLDVFPSEDPEHEGDLKK